MLRESYGYIVGQFAYAGSFFKGIVSLDGG
jgi:hypothetical protein